MSGETQSNAHLRGPGAVPQGGIAVTFGLLSGRTHLLGSTCVQHGGPDMANKIVTFTLKQMADPGIGEIVGFLEGLAQDGEITGDEIAALSEALAREEVDQSIPGVEFLRTVLSGVDFTREIEVAQRAEIHRAILRVLPKAQRAEAERARQQAGIQRVMLRRHEASLPTQRQLEYITALGALLLPT